MPIVRFFELDSRIHLRIHRRFPTVPDFAVPVLYIAIHKNLQVSGKLVAAEYRYMEPGGPVINLEIVNLKSVFSH